ncbi:MAG: hypothetical protein J5653_10155 [Clostridiales bacterium]|nr:hypothetical protein [Clostridiales bacterium]
MLGDELKKALEPIQASDELLEKTRKAIEQARLQQAKETLAKKSEPQQTVLSTAPRSSANRSYYWKAIIPIACAVLLFAGAILILPNLAKSNTDSKTGARGEIQEHNDAIADVVAEIDGLENKDAYYAEDTQAATWESETESADRVQAETTETTNNDKSVDGSGSLSLSDIDPYYKNKTLMFSPNLTDRLSVKNSVEVGEYNLCVSDDQKDLYLKDASTGEEIENNGEHSAPGIKSQLEADEKISGLLYDEEYGILYISTIERDWTNRESVHLFICGYADGKVTKEPERAG